MVLSVNSSPLSNFIDRDPSRLLMFKSSGSVLLNLRNSLSLMSLEAIRFLVRRNSLSSSFSCPWRNSRAIPFSSSAIKNSCNSVFKLSRVRCSRCSVSLKKLKLIKVFVLPLSIIRFSLFKTSFEMLVTVGSTYTISSNSSASLFIWLTSSCLCRCITALDLIFIASPN